MSREQHVQKLRLEKAHLCGEPRKRMVILKGKRIKVTLGSL